MRKFEYTGIHSISHQSDDVLSGHVVSEKIPLLTERIRVEKANNVLVLYYY